jgi:hypothetical protein
VFKIELSLKLSILGLGLIVNEMEMENSCTRSDNHSPDQYMKILFKNENEKSPNWIYEY